MESVCPVNRTPFIVSVVPVAFHTQIVLSADPETIHCPSCEIATELIQPVCPDNGVLFIFPVIAFHTQIVPSAKPETICCPSQENATELTESVCPVNGPPSIVPVIVKLAQYSLFTSVEH